MSEKVNLTWITMLAVLLLTLFVISTLPFVLIWSLNTLFPVLAIEYTFHTWLAASIVVLFFSNNLMIRMK